MKNGYRALLAGTAIAATAAQAAETVSYSYDVHGRLVATRSAGGPSDGVERRYSHDRADNRELLTVVETVTPTFSVGDAAATEGNALVFAVTRGGSLAGTLQVSYATVDSTAIAGSDFDDLTGVVTFTANDASETVAVPTTPDGTSESSETMKLRLFNASGGAAIVRQNAIGTITDKITNPPPVTEPDTLSTSKCVSKSVDVVTNDSDANGVILVDVETTTLGTTDVDATGTSVLFVPLGNPGSKTIDYVVEDGLGAEARGKLTISVSDDPNCQPEN